MNKITCEKCLEILSSEKTEEATETESMDVSFYEDMKKSQALAKIMDSEEPQILCKFCREKFEDYIKLQIADAEKESNLLDKSILECQKQILELESIDEFDVITEIQLLAKSNDDALIDIIKCQQIIEELNQEYTLLLENEKIIEYNILTEYDNTLENSIRNCVINSEIQFLSSKSLLLRVFYISSFGKFGTINKMRLGRLDYEMVPWDEINAA